MPGEGRGESDIDVTIDRKIADLFIHHHATRTHRLRYSKSWYSFFMGNGDDYQDGVGKQCHRNDPCILTSEQPGQQRYRSWGRTEGGNSTAEPNEPRGDKAAALSSFRDFPAPLGAAMSSSSLLRPSLFGRRSLAAVFSSRHPPIQVRHAAAAAALGGGNLLM